MNRLAGKVCVITGAAGGMGRVATELFCREGARVIAADLSEEGGKEAVEFANAAGPGAAIFVRADSLTSGPRSVSSCRPGPTLSAASRRPNAAVNSSATDS